MYNIIFQFLYYCIPISVIFIIKILYSIIAVFTTKYNESLKYCYIIIRIFKIINFVQLLQMLLFYY